jgi:adenylosuccinate synthase
VFRQIPAAADAPGAHLLLSAGCIIDVEVLLQEVNALPAPERVIVDPRAVIVTDADKKAEAEGLSCIGSTCSGTGMAAARRASRLGAQLVGDCAMLRDRIRVEPVAPILHQQLDIGADVIVEGTQGFGLSLLHGPQYPFVTSRDTTAAGFAMEVGLSPRQIDSIIMVIRTFPIRVGGPSGPLPGEINWAEIARASGAPNVVPEYTSVTKRLRRVGRFDPQLVRLACMYNRPTAIAVMGLDRLDYRNHRVSKYADLTPTAKSFVAKVEEELTGCAVMLVGTGFATSEVVWLSVCAEAAHG